MQHLRQLGIKRKKGMGRFQSNLYVRMRQERQQSPTLIAGHRLKLGPHAPHRLVQSIIARSVDDINRALLRDADLDELRNEVLDARIVRLD